MIRRSTVEACGLEERRVSRSCPASLDRQVAATMYTVTSAPTT
jgi:hypothetical protein